MALRGLSPDAHPSDKDKNVRWMGHSFIRCGSVTPVADCYKAHCD